MFLEMIRVLVVEDHAEMLEGIRALLGGGHFQVVGHAEDGATGVRAAEKHHPDVVVMDIGLPDLDGMEATRQIRDRLPGTRIILLSAFVDADVEQRAVTAGASAVIDKAQVFDRLAAVIRQLVV
jgi:DNA-binding NarL/FixJ family response regulator